MMKFRHILVLVVCSILFLACDDDGGGGTSSILTLEFSGLRTPSDGFVYGVWLKENAVFSPLGEFTITDAGNITNSIYSIERSRLAKADGLLISYETAGFTSNEPSSIRILAGDFINKGAQLTTAHADAMGIEFSDVMAAYILSTPTDGNPISNFAGLWYYDPSDSSSTLSFPVLTSSWKYESWIGLEDENISMGKFSDGQIADEADNYGGLAPGYPVPGQDFLIGRNDFPLDLTSKELFLTVEPVADTDSLPFVLRIFETTIVDTIATVPVPVEFDERLIPRGLAVR